MTIRDLVERAKANQPTKWTKTLVLQWLLGGVAFLLIGGVLSIVQDDWLLFAFSVIALVCLLVVQTLFMRRPDWVAWFLTIRGFLIFVGVGTVILVAVFSVAALMLGPD